jgi:hypothetical protein
MECDECEKVMRRFLICAGAAMSALLLAVPAACLAQMYRPDRLSGIDAGPGLSLNLSASSVHALNAEFDDDFRALDAFGGGKRGMDRFPRAFDPAPSTWKFYGRFYLVNFQNQLGDPQSGMRFTWRRTGPGIPTSRIYFAFHRQF